MPELKLARLMNMVMGMVDVPGGGEGGGGNATEGGGLAAEAGAAEEACAALGDVSDADLFSLVKLEDAGRANCQNDRVLVAMKLSAYLSARFTPAEICAEFASRGLPVPVDKLDAVVDADGPFVISSLDDLITFYERDKLLQLCSVAMTYFGDCSMAVARFLTIMLLDALNVHYLIPPEAVEAFMAAQGDGSADVPVPPAFAGMGDHRDLKIIDLKIIDSIAQLVSYELVTAKGLKPVLSALYLRHAGDFGVMAEQLARSLLRRIKPGITIDLPAALIEAQCGAWDIIPAEAPAEEDGDASTEKGGDGASLGSARLKTPASVSGSAEGSPASKSNAAAASAAEVEVDTTAYEYGEQQGQEAVAEIDGEAGADGTGGVAGEGTEGTGTGGAEGASGGASGAGTGGTGSGGASGAGGGKDEKKKQKKPRLVWTTELHSRFMNAVHHLGVKNAVPKTILQLMNVDGMTRENVASHLQKYRLYLKRTEEDPTLTDADADTGGHCAAPSFVESGANADDALGKAKAMPAPAAHEAGERSMETSVDVCALETASDADCNKWGALSACPCAAGNSDVEASFSDAALVSAPTPAPQMATSSSSYKMFVKAHTQEVRDANPGLGQIAVFTKVAELWKVAPENPEVRQRGGLAVKDGIATTRVDERLLALEARMEARMQSYVKRLEASEMEVFRLKARVRELEGAAGAEANDGASDSCAADLPRACSHCGKSADEVKREGGKLRLCARCNDLATRYCCRECQVAHWPAHKVNCRRLTKTASADR